MKYLKLRAYHKFLNKETGETENRTFGFRNCSKAIDLGETIKMGHLYDDMKRSHSVLCPDISAQDKLFLEGCPESHDFWTVEFHVEKCNNDSKWEGEPDCASPE